MVHDQGKNATGRIWHLKDDQIESKSNVVQVSQELIPNHNQTSGKLEHFSVAANHPLGPEIDFHLQRPRI